MSGFSNSDKLIAVIVEWARPMVSAVVASRINKAPQVAAANAWVKKYFPVSADYSIVNDLAFLVQPVGEVMIEPIVRNAISSAGLDDAGIPQYADKLVNSLLEEAEKKGKVSLFNAIELDKSDFERLQQLLQRNLPITKTEKYEVLQ